MKVLCWYVVCDFCLSELECQVLWFGEVELEVVYCGICGSDLYEYQSGLYLIFQVEVYLLFGCCVLLIFGYEFCGVVVVFGFGVEGLCIGDCVVVELEYCCGECCYCWEGCYNFCELMGFIGLMGDGGFVECVWVLVYMLYCLLDVVGFCQVVVFELVVVVLYVLCCSSLVLGQCCVVFGFGLIGLLLVMFVCLCGIEDIVVIDVSFECFVLVGEFGVSWVFDVCDGDMVVCLCEGGVFDCVFEVVGSQVSFDVVLVSLCKGGELVLVSLMGEVWLDVFDLVNCELCLFGSVGYCDVYLELIVLFVDGCFDLVCVVICSVFLEQVVEYGFEVLLCDKLQVKVLVNFNLVLVDV